MQSHTVQEKIPSHTAQDENTLTGNSGGKYLQRQYRGKITSQTHTVQEENTLTCSSGGK